LHPKTHSLMGVCLRCGS